jgi:7-cyano-7-deazaguanine synthase
VYKPNPSLVMALSGGLDSTTLLHYAVKEHGFKEVLTLSFDYGQRHGKEIKFARCQAEIVSARYGVDVKFHVMDLSELHLVSHMAQSALVNRNVEVPKLEEVLGDPQPSTYVPFRNMLFLTYSLAAAEAFGAGHVYYGAQRHDVYGYWDTTPEFVSAMGNVAALNRKNPIAIRAPFVDYSKAEVLKWGLKNEVNYAQTWSCYKGEAEACGVCPTCVERLTAFRTLDVADPLPYATLEV